MGQEAKEVFWVAVNVSIINAAGGWFPVALSIPVPRELNWQETFQRSSYSVQKYQGRETGLYVPAIPINPPDTAQTLQVSLAASAWVPDLPRHREIIEPFCKHECCELSESML